ncbi:MAG: O-antigen ligase family protein [Candidatus Sulfotelmatobacter sp.]|nr:O-antigen ligase family protein [Candidatus Sulfotelmatobacter sp.]
MSSRPLKMAPAAGWAGEATWQGVRIGLRSLQAMMAVPTALFLGALAAMLLRHPDVSFYEIDRIAFVLLVVGVAGRAVVTRQRLLVMERATWPMIALTLLAVGSVIQQPFDNHTWCLLAAKFIVPFSLFHLAALVFQKERRLEQFETFALLVLAYLCFTSIAFLVGAKSLIFPRFILDESLGYHADRARGPLLQAVANGVSLNLLGVLALHSFLRGRIRGLKAAALLASLPIAILATMTRAVWLSFAVSMGVLIFRTRNRGLRRICLGVSIVGVLALLVMLSFADQRRAFSDRLQESGPLNFRQAVYSGGWQMFLEKPLTGWGVNQMPSELARHVSGYKERELYPHNTYLELLVEHGLVGFALYAWLMWEIFKLRRCAVPHSERDGFLNQQFHAIWPVLLGVYWVNAAVVVMNYQFVNGLLFTMAGMLAAQRRRAAAEASS